MTHDFRFPEILTPRACVPPEAQENRVAMDRVVLMPITAREARGKLPLALRRSREYVLKLLPNGVLWLCRPWKTNDRMVRKT